MIKSESFTSRYKPKFDPERDEWILQVPCSDVKLKSDNFYEVRLPVYASRALAIGGNILRKQRRAYREWLLDQQGQVCAICGKGTERGNPWNLDHQPPLADTGSKFIDYARLTRNRVIHQKCDPAQKSKKHS
jgi:hypothetical protein